METVHVESKTETLDPKVLETWDHVELVVFVHTLAHVVLLPIGFGATTHFMHCTMHEV